MANHCVLAAYIAWVFPYLLIELSRTEHLIRMQGKVVKQIKLFSPQFYLFSLH